MNEELRKEIVKKATTTSIPYGTVKDKIEEGLELIEVRDVFEPVSFDGFSYKSEKPSLTIDEAMDVLHHPSEFKKKYDNPVLGFLNGCYFVPNGVSRNRRFYSEGLWKKTLSLKEIHESLKNGMLGMFEHPRVKEFYSEEGRPTGSHPIYAGMITKKLFINKAMNESRQSLGYGKSYVIDTPVGKIMDTMMRAKDEAGQPLMNLFMSSRAWSRYVGKDSQQNDIMDENNYYLKTFDGVTDPGFLEAHPRYTAAQIQESLDDAITEILTICEGVSCQCFDNPKNLGVLKDWKPESKFLINYLG